MENNFAVLLKLVSAGLWENEVQLSLYGEIDYSRVLSLAEEQSVVGLVAAGLEHVVDSKPAKQDILQFVGLALQLEQQNTAMNYFVGDMVNKMRKDDIYTLLLKGQGIAQCYERPLWRSNGDVDFFLSEDNYNKAKDYLKQIGKLSSIEERSSKHIAFTIEHWLVELHGTLRCGISFRMDRELDKIWKDTFYGGEVRSWNNDRTTVFLLEASNDAVYVFSHFLKHFYKGGLGIRQICDWCRLLWTYRETINWKKIEARVRRMGLLSEWKTFAAFAVEYLGMFSKAMPLYDDAEKWKRKAKKICDYIMNVSKFGHNRDLSYHNKYPYIIRKAVSFSRRVSYAIKNATIFPLDSVRFLVTIMFNGIRSVIRRE